MVAVAPFRGLLFDPEVAGNLAEVTSPPYDVVLPHERDQLHRSSPYNIALVDIGADVEEAPHEKYTRAGRILRDWQERRVLVPTDSPSVFPYEMEFGYRGKTQRVRGVLLEVALEPLHDGGAILAHERTMAAPVEDRLLLMRATAADLSPIYAVVGGPSGSQTELLDGAAARPPDRELSDEDGVAHRLWVEPLPEDLRGWYRDQSLLIADGHHRYQTALAHRRERRAEAGPGPWDAVMMLVVDAATERPPVLPIHRVLSFGSSELPELPGDRVHGLEEVLARLVDDDLRFGAAFRTEAGLTHLVGRLEGPPPTVAALHTEILDGFQGVRDLRFVPDASLAETEVREGHADLALFLPPARVDYVREAAARGGTLPQKSTFFWPKPRTGMVIRPMNGPPD